MEDDDVIRRNFVERRRRLYRLAREVNERLRFDQQDFHVVDGTAGHFRLEFLGPAGKIMAMAYFIHRHKSDIVTVVLIFLAGIA